MMNREGKRAKRMPLALCAALALLAALAFCGCSQGGGAAVQDPDAIEGAEIAVAVNDNENKPTEVSVQPAEQAAAQETPAPAASEDAAQPQAAPAAPTGAGNAGGKLVVIDPGHQGEGDSSQEPIGPGAYETKARVTSGTSGAWSGLDEHEVNLAVGLKLRDYLQSQGVNVIMVRETADINISNSERAAIANDNHADLFIRLHCDGADDSSAQGFSTLIPGYNDWTGPIVEQSRVAGEMVHAAALAATGAQDRGIVERTDLSGFNWCTVPTVLCEMGFMSNEEEDLRLATDEYQQKLAVGIGNGAIQYLGTL